MNEAVLKALELAKTKQDDRLMPIILDLEQKKNHQAMFWLLDILEIVVLNSKHERTPIWLGWLENLSRIVEGIELYTADEMNRLSKSIFNAPSARNLYLNLISHAYVIEAIYRYRTYDKYVNHLLHITIHLCNKFETIEFSVFDIALDLYEKHILRLNLE